MPLMENERSTPAVPIGSNRILSAIRAKAGNRTTFSGLQASATRPTPPPCDMLEGGYQDVGDAGVS